MTHRSCLALLVALAAGSCRAESDDEAETAPVPERVDKAGRILLSPAEIAALDLQTDAARRDKLSLRSQRYGRVVAHPEQETLVAAPMTARLLAPPSVQLGSEVRAGEALLIIEPLLEASARSGLAAQRWELRGQVVASRSQLRALEAELERVTRLVAARLATGADEARARAALEAEQARLDSLRGAGGALDTGSSLPLRASAGGVVAALESRVGAVFEQGAVLARLVRVGACWVDVSAAPADEPGSAYRVRTPAGSWLAARLLSRGMVVAADGTRHDRVELAAPDAAAVLTGSIVAVEVVREVEGVIAPEQAVVLKGSQPLVFVETATGQFAPREVALGARGDGRVVVSGVAPGESVVTRGAMALLGELGQASTERAEQQ